MNPINESGSRLEEQLEKYLIKNNIPYRRAKSGKHEIDFIIGDYYADCTNQNTIGSVEEKIPHKVWKYHQKYNYTEVYIIRGDYVPSTSVIEHLNTYSFKTHIVTLEEFTNMLSNVKINNPLEQFFE